MKEQLNLFPNETDTFDFESRKQDLIDNLDMLKEMTVQEQTLYKKWQEMNKGGKMSKIKKKLLGYKNNLWAPTDITDFDLTIKEILEIDPYVIMAESGKGVTEWVN